MSTSYREKVIISGKTLEHYKYNSQTIKTGFERKPFRKKPNPNKIKRIYSFNRSRTTLRRLIDSNPDMQKFVTLTFAENVTNLTAANAVLKLFFMRLKWFLGDFDLKYIAIPEFQKRGAVHYHILTNIPFVASDVLSSLWGEGFVKINSINSVKRVGCYVSKYMSKANSDTRLFSRKSFFRSKNINTPTIFIDTKAVLSALAFFNCLEADPHYSVKLDNKYIGEVIYSQYSLNEYVYHNTKNYEQCFL